MGSQWSRVATPPSQTGSMTVAGSGRAFQLFSQEASFSSHDSVFYRVAYSRGESDPFAFAFESESGEASSLGGEGVQCRAGNMVRTTSVGVLPLKSRSAPAHTETPGAWASDVAHPPRRVPPPRRALGVSGRRMLAFQPHRPVAPGRQARSHGALATRPYHAEKKKHASDTPAMRILDARM